MLSQKQHSPLIPPFDRRPDHPTDRIKLSQIPIIIRYRTLATFLRPEPNRLTTAIGIIGKRADRKIAIQENT